MSSLVNARIVIIALFCFIAAGETRARTTYGPIPIDAKRWYQLDNVSNGLEGLFDNVIKVPVTTGWGKVLYSYDAYYPILPGERITIDSVKFYDGAGSNVSDPFSLYYIDSAWNRVLIGVFVGTEYNDWVGPDVSDVFNFALKVPATDVRYLVINCSGIYPDEMKLYGSYTAPTPLPAAPAKNIPFKQELGVNGFEWDFEDPTNPGVIDPARLAAAKNFSAFRHYLDWSNLEPKKDGYTYNPSHNGSWNYDSLYQRCKVEGIEVLADIKTQPDYMAATYPKKDRDPENVPVDYGADYSDPASYARQAMMAFQFAARYGYNKSVSTSLLSVDASTRWPGDGVNVVKVGLGVVTFMECDNERDKWWKDRLGYQTGREYAANLSAFYDGHKNTMGPGVGVKNADPAMQVVMAGTASATTDYFRGMIDWCKEFRGYNKDGSVNLCWDIINYHLYTTNDVALRGAAPEVAHADTTALDFVNAAHVYARDMPVWVTEAGYDINQSSEIKAIPIKGKNEFQTQADWLLRTSLLYARCGVARTFFYEMYDDDTSNPTNYSSSGLINPDHSRKPAADYVTQANKLIGDYVYKETISANPIVDRYELGGRSAYVLVKPSEDGSTIAYSLPVGGSATARLYTPAVGQDTMSVTTVTATSGHLSLTVGETPVFLLPTAGTTVLGTAENTTIMPLLDVAIFPNPASQEVRVRVNSDYTDDVRVTLYSADGRACYSHNYKKSAALLSTTLDISGLAGGIYFMEITQGGDKVVKKVVKTN